MNGIYRIVFVQRHGFGWFTPEDWAVLSPRERDLILILATVGTEEEAKRAFEALPQHWEDVDLHYQGGEWWESAGVYVSSPQGQDIELFRPVDCSLPVIPVATGKLPPPPDRPKLLTD